MSDTEQHEGDGTRAQRVLLVEDNEAASKGLARLLEARGYVVSAAADGRSAFQLLEGDNPPDFLLTDMQLPDLDGRELARQARQLLPGLRVVLITGWDLETLDRQHQAEWGVECVLTKPLDMQELFARLAAPASPG